MRTFVIRICQLAALIVMFGLGALLLERVYIGMVRGQRVRRRGAFIEVLSARSRNTLPIPGQKQREVGFKKKPEQQVN